MCVLYESMFLLLCCAQREGKENPKQISFPINSAKPKIEWHLEKDPKKFDLMNVSHLFRKAFYI